GQVYSGHYADGLTAFFFNAVFLGSAAAMYSLERRSNTKHTGSILLGAVGLVFYAANIAGGASAAVHFNLYQERTFQEKVRQSALNVDRAERAIQIRINVPLKP
ncbi:MAG: hypothetical protein HY042_02865, partial [Spirochaetia bacterium]|nr:hypothetical protein [Spirochaetia bacterium]